MERYLITITTLDEDTLNFRAATEASARALCRLLASGDVRIRRFTVHLTDKAGLIQKLIFDVEAQ